jgi:hypothetical protein
MGGVYDGWATCGQGPKSSIEFCFKWPPNILQEGGGVMELDNEGGIGLGYVLEHEGRGYVIEQWGIIMRKKLKLTSIVCLFVCARLSSKELL